MADKLFKDYFDERTEQSSIQPETKILVKSGNNDVEKIPITAFATASQGAKADTALQPDGNGSQLTNVDASTLNGLDENDFATASQGAAADNSIQKSGFTTQVIEGDILRLKGNAPAYWLFEEDTNTYFRIVTSGGIIYFQAGASGAGAVTSSGNIRFTGLLGADINSLKVQKSTGLEDIWDSGNLPLNNLLLRTGQTSQTVDGEIESDGFKTPSGTASQVATMDGSIQEIKTLQKTYGERRRISVFTSNFSVLPNSYTHIINVSIATTITVTDSDWEDGDVLLFKNIGSANAELSGISYLDDSGNTSQAVNTRQTIKIQKYKPTSASGVWYKIN